MVLFGEPPVLLVFDALFGEVLLPVGDQIAVFQGPVLMQGGAYVFDSDVGRDRAGVAVVVAQPFSDRAAGAVRAADRGVFDVEVVRPIPERDGRSVDVFPAAEHDAVVLKGHARRLDIDAAGDVRVFDRFRFADRQAARAFLERRAVRDPCISGTRITTPFRMGKTAARTRAGVVRMDGCRVRALGRCRYQSFRPRRPRTARTKPRSGHGYEHQPQRPGCGDSRCWTLAPDRPADSGAIKEAAALSTPQRADRPVARTGGAYAYFSIWGSRSPRVVLRGCCPSSCVPSRCRG